MLRGVVGALAVWIEYRIAVLFLNARQAVSLTLLFAFGTSQWPSPAATASSMG